MPGSVAILDALASLLEAEQNSVFRLMGEDSPYLRQAPTDVRQALQEMVRSSQQHEDELRQTIRLLSGTPTGPRRPDPDEPLLNFLSLKFLLPKLVNSKELMVERYQNALRAITAQDGDAVPVLRRHLAQHEDDLRALNQAVGLVVKSG